MSDADGRPDWAWEIRDKRSFLCWTQKELARELEQAADPRTRARLPSRASLIRQIRFHEAGTHQPGPLYAELYRRVWARHLQPRRVADAEDLPGDHLDLAWTVGRLNQRVDRRMLLQLATTATAGTALEPAQRLMKALTGDHRPDPSTIAHLEDRTRGLHRLEEHYPGRSLRPAVLVHLSEICALLEGGGMSNSHRQRLMVIAGESAILAAWFAWEQGDMRKAAANARVATLVARQTSDAAIAACMAGYRTYMTGGDSASSIRLAVAALDRLENGDPATRAWLLARCAEESALVGDHPAALRAIREAEEVYATANINARPWTCFLDPGRFASMSLTVHSRLRREADSIATMDEILLHLGPATETKKLCVVNAELALARYRLGNVAEAVASARSAMVATTEMAFPLGWERLDQVATELESSRAQAAREFRAEYAATRPKTEKSSLP